jgi:hypothetical protein
VAIVNSVINVKDFGAKGNGTTDDSQAFRDAITFVYNNYTNLPNYSGGGDGNRRAIYQIYIPAGTFKITQPESMMPSTFTTPMMGVSFVGNGKFATAIDFQPSAAGSFLLSNNNCFLHILFRDLSFVSGTANSNFMKSTSQFAAQNYIFDNVAWGGTWTYGLQLFGSNTNSEMSWYHCNINGTWDTFFYVPNSVGMVGDQFVNYNFYAVNFEVSRGTFINAQYGGSINIWGGSIMYYSGGTGGTMFILGNSLHNGGAERFMCSGTRIELPNANCRMIDSTWSTGSITFISVDNSSQQFQGISVTGGVNSIFRFGNESGATVTFIGCVLQGKHEYRYARGYDRDGRATYINCEFWHYNDAASFITMTNENGGSFKAGAPLIKFDQCRGKPQNNQNKYIFDTTLNWNMKKFATVTKKILRIVSWENELPSQAGGNISEDVWLPIGAVITSVQVYGYPKTAGGTSSTTAGWVFTLKTSEGTTLITATPTSNNPSLGMNVTQAQNFICDSDLKRHVVFAANTAVNAAAKGYCLVEYIG